MDSEGDDVDGEADEETGESERSAAGDGDSERESRSGSERGSDSASAEAAEAGGEDGGSEESGDDGAADDGGDDNGETGEGGDDEATPLVPGSERAGSSTRSRRRWRPPTAGTTPRRGSRSGERRPLSARERSAGPDRERGFDDRIDRLLGPGGGREGGAGGRGARPPAGRRAADAETLLCFAVDASASMRGPMRAAKGAAIDLLRDAYEHRGRRLGWWRSPATTPPSCSRRPTTWDGRRAI
ncbi:hypothetical protein [Halorubrum saccharovorum]|uniref:hypothetical protein n=1 Tax=Halorubrum saccharovorum TaxID=2248 RepID=UPI0006795663|nr:hypothetical protein [Halorubrum saccharovorum]